MADSGFNWDAAWAYVQIGAADWNDNALADAAEEISDAISLDGKAAAHFTFTFVEDNTGAIDGKVSIYLYSDIDGTNFEERAVGNPWYVQVTPVQNDTVYTSISVLASDYSQFKIGVFNDSGQELAVDVRVKYATIPAAS